MLDLKKIKGLVYAFGFFTLYYVISVAVSFVTELAVILRYFPSYVTERADLTETQYIALMNKLYSLDGVMRIISTFLVIAAIALIFKIKKIGFRETLGIKMPCRGLGVLSYFGGVFSGVSLSCLIAVLPIPSSWSQANAVSIKNVTTGNTVLVIISVFIMAPLLEEFVFRGVMLGMIKKYWGIIPAILITAVIFGIIHGNILQGLYTFIAALIFSYFRYRGDSFWCAFLAHCGFNMSNILIQLMGDVSVLTKLIMGVLSLTLIICGAEFVFSDKAKIEKEDENI